MKKFFLLFGLAVVSISVGAQDDNIVAENAVIIKAGTGYGFTEGPAASKSGQVYFTDQPNDKIYVWDEKKGISLYLDGTGRSNGMFFDKDGNLVACADLHNQLVVFGKDKKMKVLYEGYGGTHLNGPNDLWITPQGGIYFSDPYYARDYWESGHKETQNVRGVYYRSPAGKVIRVIDDFKQPNGLIGTSDGKTLYASDINDRKVWKYEIHADGTLGNKTLFAPNGADGMTIDNRGDVYLCAGRILVYSREGKLIKEITVPESPANICFGGRNHNILFITARTSVYTLQMSVKGVE